jgi:hypothetical protein
MLNGGVELIAISRGAVKFCGDELPPLLNCHLQFASPFPFAAGTGIEFPVA